ncbi:hypothetical protein V8G54_017302 [Vigna mungo]|uniref:Uncharacterized protein n=1 Tax=Vigna mungo TaxID=3915 RepID=A0AAQ3NQE3_VIGMU
MWQGKESKSESKRQVYGYTKNQRCKRLLLDPQGMVQKLSYRITLHGKCQPIVLSEMQRERERYEETKQKPRKAGLSKGSKVSALKFPFCPFKLYNLWLLYSSFTFSFTVHS